MPQQTEPRDNTEATPQRNQEPAEGSRENVNVGEQGGISNRPVDEEQREQEDLPPRGGRKDGAHA
jgi:hypothetical protein